MPNKSRAAAPNDGRVQILGHTVAIWALVPRCPRLLWGTLRILLGPDPRLKVENSGQVPLATRQAKKAGVRELAAEAPRAELAAGREPRHGPDVAALGRRPVGP